MRKTTMFTAAAACLLLTLSPFEARADILGTMGDMLKKGGAKAAELFKKGKEKISSLFNKADPDKLPHILNNLSESQTRLNEKQQALLKLTTRRSGGNNAMLQSFLHERTSDLVQARRENEKLFQQLQELLNALSKKKVDLSQYQSVLQEVHRAQAVLDKNQAVLQRQFASSWPAGDGGKTAQPRTETGESEQLNTRLANSASNPYAAAGAAKDGNMDDTVYGSSLRPGSATGNRTGAHAADSASHCAAQGSPAGPAAPAPAAGATTSRPRRASPNDKTCQGLIDQWLAMKGLNPFGIKIVPGLKVAANPDTDGRSRYAYVWANFPELRNWVRARFNNGPAISENSNVSTTAQVPADTTAATVDSGGSAASGADVSTDREIGSNTANLDRDYRSGVSDIQKAIASGADREKLKQLYQRQAEQEKARNKSIREQTH